MKILFFGDIFGKPGRKILYECLPSLTKKYKPNFIIANAENASHGKGLNKKHFLALQQIGINCFTMGNHTWDKNEIYEFIDDTKIVRPYNISNESLPGQKGCGSRIYTFGEKKIRVTNLLGSSIYIKFPLLNPFLIMEREILKKEEKANIHIVDFHAETTSEKNAFRYDFDGQVSAIFGTHTHVATFDARISAKKTFYVTDVGMCGPGYNSVIGANPECALAKFKDPEKKFQLQIDRVDQQLNGIFLQFDKQTDQPIYFEQIKIIR